MHKLLQIILSIFLLSAIVLSQTYVGSDACSTCHSTKYSSWKDSGHPYKFSVIENTKWGCKNGLNNKKCY